MKLKLTIEISVKSHLCKWSFFSAYLNALYLFWSDASFSTRQTIDKKFAEYIFFGGESICKLENPQKKKRKLLAKKNDFNFVS